MRIKLTLSDHNRIERALEIFPLAPRPELEQFIIDQKARYALVTIGDIVKSNDERGADTCPALDPVRRILEETLE